MRDGLHSAAYTPNVALRQSCRSPLREAREMEETSRITYAGEFVQISGTSVQGPLDDKTEYVGGDVPQWEPVIKSSEELAPTGTD